MNQKGMIVALIGTIAGALSIYTIGIIFVPIGLLFGLIGLIIAIKHKVRDSILLSIAALCLSIVGIIVSPTLWILLGSIIFWNDPENQEAIHDLKNAVKSIQWESSQANHPLENNLVIHQLNRTN